MTKEDYFLNDHEKDALAAARFAYKRYGVLLRKINSYAKKYNKRKIEDDIIEKVVKTECSIVHAVEQIEHKEIVKEVKKKEIKEKRASVETILRKENLALRKWIANLQGKLKTLTAKTERLEGEAKEMIKRKPREQIISQKEQIIRTLRRDLGIADTRLKKIESEKKDLVRELVKLDHKILIKCLPNLGMQALERIKQILKKNDVIYVEDPNSFSEKAVKELKKLDIDLVIHDKPLTNKVKKMMPFVFVQRKEVKIKIFDDIGFLEKEILEKHKKLIVRKVIEDYWAERKL